MGMGANAAGGMMGGLQQPVQQQPPAQQPAEQAAQDDPLAKLRQLKGLVDDGILSQEEFEAAKARILGGLGL